MHPLAVPLCALFAVSVLAQQPTARTGAFNLNQARICYDEARSRLVLGNDIGTLMEWDGVAWAIGNQPSPLYATTTYDWLRRRVYFVGTEVREYDGHTQRSLGASSLMQRLVADPVQGRLVGARSVTIGGVAQLAIEAFDGTQWAQVATIPGVQTVAGMCVDRARNRIVINTTGTSGVFFRTWELDGSTLLGPFVDGSQRGVCEFDVTRSQVVTMAGNGAMQAWTGSAWSSIPGPLWPAFPQSVATNPARGWIHALMRQPGGANEHWRWNGTDWAPVGSDPQPLGEAVLHYAPARARTQLLAYHSGGFDTRVHAEWDGIAWRFLPFASHAPTTLQGAASSFDQAHNELLVFGGVDVGWQVLGTTHVHDGTNWRVAATTGPSPRQQAAMAYDPVRQRVVLVGGNGAGSGAPIPLLDHWEWDGVAWSLIHATTPMGGLRAMMGFDAVRGELVALDAARRTFAYRAGAWTLLDAAGPTFSPLTRPLTWNPDAGALQCVGLQNNLWLRVMQWNGSSWSGTSDPIGEYAFDTVRGTTYIVRSADTLVYSTAHATAVDYGSPCGGTSTVTSLSAFGRPRFGAANFHLDLRAEAASRPALLGFGLGQTAIPLGHGCEFLLANPFATRVWFTDANGFCTMPLPLPNSPALRGFSLVAQGAVLDPNSPGSLALSQGLALTIGD